MPGRHFPREERMHHVEMATLDIVAELGIDAVTLTAVADRAGVSRQWLHTLFPNLNALYMDMYQSMRFEYFRADEALPLGLAERREFIKKIYAIYFDVPIGLSMIGSFALNGRSGLDRSKESLHSLYLATFCARYVDPMVELGYPRDEVLAGMMAMQNSAYSLAIACDRGIIDRAPAIATLHRSIDTHVAALEVYDIS
jgi:AcrR family transcriptional regulator